MARRLHLSLGWPLGPIPVDTLIREEKNLPAGIILGTTQVQSKRHYCTWRTAQFIRADIRTLCVVIWRTTAAATVTAVADRKRVVFVSRAGTEPLGSWGP